MLIHSGIVCACAPALKPLIVKIVPRFSSRQNSRKSTFRGTKDTHKDDGFIELRGKSSTNTTSVEVEQDERALPNRGPEQAPHTIRVRTDVEQQFDDINRDTDTESERNLVTGRPYRRP